MDGAYEFAGRDSAQMIGLALPFDEIVVKNPGSCAPPNAGEVSNLG